MTDSDNDILACWQCGKAVKASWRVCPHCHALIYRDALEKLAEQAAALESGDLPAAIETWKQALDLLPGDSQQASMVRSRIDELSRHLASGSMPAPPAGNVQATEASHDNWQMVLLKTGGSALFSMWLLHSMSGDWWFAAGLISLILIHECGHWVANIYYGIRASPPIFLGPLGAVIMLRQPPPNAKIESIMGIAGPVFGTIGALGMFAYWKYSGNMLAHDLCYFGFWLNLFNLIPLPPLDGGRTVAAVSPRIWPLGIAGMIGLGVYRFYNGRLSDFTLFMLVYILMSAWPRVVMTLKFLPQLREYYNVPMSFRVAIGLLHAGLAIGLYVMMKITGAPWFF
jgi:Zn-dependent protease